MNHQKVAQLVQEAYASSKDPFAHWMWDNHLQVVAREAEILSEKHGAKADLAVAGAWLHDFGDAYVHRHSPEHERISKEESTRVLQTADYSAAEIRQVLDDVIAPHSCRGGQLPTTLEGKVMATADAIAHLSTDFYLQFSWLHLPEGKTYAEYIEWVNEKLDRDFNQKIRFEDSRQTIKSRYEALKEVLRLT